MGVPNCSLIKWMRACLREWQGRGSHLEVVAARERVHDGECRECRDIMTFQQLIDILAAAGVEA
jgi:hypothetical protein